MAARRSKRGRGARPRDAEKLRRTRRRAAIFGANLRRLREEQGFSQEDFAFEAKVHRTHIGKCERGEVDPTISTAVDMANALGVSLAVLTEGID